MAGLRKFFGGVISGGLVAGLTLVVASQVSQPRVAPAVVPGAETASGGVVLPRPEGAAPTVEVGADTAAVPAVADVATNQGSAPADETLLPAMPEVSVAMPETGVAALDVAKPDPSAPSPTGIESAEADAAAAVAPATGAQPEVALVEPNVTAPEVAAPAEVATLPANDQTDAPVLSATPPAAPQVEVPAQSVPETSDDPPAASSGQPDGLVAEVPGPLTLPLADGAPEDVQLPPPPPLTPEEVASLADPARLVLPAPEVETDSGQVGAPVADPAETPPVAVETAEPTEPDSPLPESPVIDAPEPTPAPELEPAPATVTEASPEPPADAAQPSTVAIDAAPATLMPDTGIIAQAPSTLPATPRLFTAGEGALTDRDVAEAVPEQVLPAPDAPPLPEVALDDGPAMERFAADFANPDGKPLFGILLIDSGDATLDRQAVAALPFPVSIVIDPLLPDAATHAALYRAGGKEVVMLATGIPEGATPADVEQTFQAHAAVLPEAVAVIDARVAAFQNNRPLSAQIVPILAAQGRGLLTWDRGLNAADQVARREGLPTATIFRQIDGEGEGIPLMRRYLDRAAFKAAQEGTAIVIGTLRAETVAALLEWTIEGRASTVALAPASALLRGNE